MPVRTCAPSCRPCWPRNGAAEPGLDAGTGSQRSAGRDPGTRRSRLGAVRRTSPADADTGHVRGRPDHHCRAVDHGDGADVDHNRPHSRRTRAGRLSDGDRRRDPQRAAVGDGGGRRAAQARTETDATLHAVHGPAGPGRHEGRLRAHRIHRGAPARRSPRRLASRVEPRDHASASCCERASR